MWYFLPNNNYEQAAVILNEIFLSATASPTKQVEHHDEQPRVLSQPRGNPQRLGQTNHYYDSSHSEQVYGGDALEAHRQIAQRMLRLLLPASRPEQWLQHRLRFHQLC